MIDTNQDLVFYSLADKIVLLVREDAKLKKVCRLQRLYIQDDDSLDYCEDDSPDHCSLKIFVTFLKPLNKVAKQYHAVKAKLISLERNDEEKNLDL